MRELEPDFDDAPTGIFFARSRPARVESDAPPVARVGLWSPRDVAGFLNVSRSWVYQKSEDGLLPVIRMPGSSLLRFDPDDIRAYARGEWSPQKSRTIPHVKPRA